MADFTTHITTSSAIGIVYGAAGHVHWQVPVPTCIVAAGLCGLSGMLPDVDSESGRTQREIMTFAAAVIPMLMVDRFSQLGLSHESMVLASACVYILVRFGIGELLNRYTVHRGMFHSIPAAMIAGLVASLVCSCEDMTLRMFKVAAVVLGYLIHLILDEMWAIDWYWGGVRFKNSFGTALKMYGRRWFANIFTYGILLIIGAIAISDPIVMEHYDKHPPRERQMMRDWVDRVLFRDQDRPTHVHDHAN